MRHSLRAFAWPSRPTTWRGIVSVICCACSLVLLAACASTPTAQTSTTVRPTVVPHATVVPTPTSTPKPVLPPARGTTQLVYDDQSGMLLLFGGSGSAPTFAPNDTWTWNGSIWTQQHPAHAPPPRDSGAIAYDAMTHQVVLFGGLSDEANTGIIADTWTWNGSDWTQQHPIHSPPARDFASMAYDAATGQLVLFGGTYKPGMGFNSLADTWTWNGSDWTQQHPATIPAARSQAAMAYDASTRALVLFGGGEAAELNDTWTWNGSNWIEQYPASKPPLTMQSGGDTLFFEHPSMTYDQAMRHIVLSQISYSQNNNERHQMGWLWDGSKWTQQPDANLDVGYGFLAYDATVQSVVELTFTLPIVNDVHSGVFEDQFWRWNGQAWKLLADWS